ncbi:hypothetical protein HPB50_020604 [Hyalomma asiaticum]|uniref:Uncharacterized protein n=1 Tax=Hyalomma asiaticum TaxID=266040 RepID=A0ACB7S470_HYAAI|nr:hypothetical protein HPB50_020604 [Hyalomma asiaticum]
MDTIRVIGTQRDPAGFGGNETGGRRPAFPELCYGQRWLPLDAGGLMSEEKKRAEARPGSSQKGSRSRAARLKSAVVGAHPSVPADTLASRERSAV